jgi:hypothetical protein
MRTNLSQQPTQSPTDEVIGHLAAKPTFGRDS